jgi:hypothetical protein
MFIVGLDLGKRKSQLCIQDATGRVVAEVRCKTERGELTTALSKFPNARVLLEACTSTQWVARHLTSLGFDVVIGDPRFGPMYSQTSKKIKTDRRDARALADALLTRSPSSTHSTNELDGDPTTTTSACSLEALHDVKARLLVVRQRGRWTRTSCLSADGAAVVRGSVGPVVPSLAG